MFDRHIDIGSEADPKTLKCARGKFGEVEVKTEWWADYVFEEGYDLKPLPEVELYIKKYGNLPNMPSEEEVVKNGLDLADITKRQQEKIEELTLHLIAEQKRTDRLENEMKELKDLIRKSILTDEVE